MQISCIADERHDSQKDLMLPLPHEKVIPVIVHCLIRLCGQFENNVRSSEGLQLLSDFLLDEWVRVYGDRARLLK